MSRAFTLGCIVALCVSSGCGQSALVRNTPPVQPVSEPPAGGTEVLVEGVSSFTGSWDSARDQALGDALRKAVEQGVGVFIDAGSVVENFQLISDRIYSRAAGFVSSYRIIAEERTDELYRVVVRAVVNTDGIMEDLAATGILVAGQGRPRVMVVVREVRDFTAASLGDAAATGSMIETLIMESFRRRGFPVVDAAAAAAVLERDQLLLILGGDEQTAALIGLQAGAEIIVSGTALHDVETRTIAGSPREIHVYRMNCRAVNTRTAAVLGASATSTEVPFSEDQARSQASSKTADQLIAAILEGWTVNENSTVIVATNADFDKLAALRSRIRTEIRGVSEVLTRDFTGSRATIEVISEIPSQEVLERLAELGGGFSITGAAGNRVEIRFSD